MVMLTHSQVLYPAERHTGVLHWGHPEAFGRTRRIARVGGEPFNWSVNHSFNTSRQAMVVCQQQVKIEYVGLCLV